MPGGSLAIGRFQLGPIHVCPIRLMFSESLQMHGPCLKRRSLFIQVAVDVIGRGDPPLCVA